MISEYWKTLEIAQLIYSFLLAPRAVWLLSGQYRPTESEEAVTGLGTWARLGDVGLCCPQRGGPVEVHPLSEAARMHGRVYSQTFLLICCTTEFFYLKRYF